MRDEPGDASDAERLGWWDRLPETPAKVDFHRHRVELNELLRAAYVAGAEEHSTRTNGRGLTDEELRETMEEYPGDMPTERRAEGGR